MKNSITFITSFIAAVSVFSPAAVAGHVDFPQDAEAGKHCELLNLPDNRVLQPTFDQKGQPVIVNIGK